MQNEDNYMQNEYNYKKQIILHVLETISTIGISWIVHIVIAINHVQIFIRLLIITINT